MDVLGISFNALTQDDIFTIIFTGEKTNDLGGHRTSPLQLVIDSELRIYH